MPNALVIGGRKSEFAHITTGLDLHDIAVVGHRTRGNGSARIPDNVDVVIGITDINRLPTLWSLVKRNARQRQIPTLTISHRWSESGPKLAAVGFPTVAKRPAPNPPRISKRGTLAAAAHTSYAWTLNYVARHPWAGNAAVKDAAAEWARLTNQPRPGNTSVNAWKAREALGIRKMGRGSDKARVVHIEQTIYEAMCKSIQVAPNAGPGTVYVNADGEPVETSRPPTGMVESLAGAKLPDAVTYRGFRCTVRRDRGIKDGCYAWGLKIERTAAGKRGKYVGAVRAQRGDVGALHTAVDDLIASNPDIKAISVQSVAAKAAHTVAWKTYDVCHVVACKAPAGRPCTFSRKRGALAGQPRGLPHERRPVLARAAIPAGPSAGLPMPPVTSPTPQPASKPRTVTPTPPALEPPMDAREAIQSLSALVWETMAQHGIVALSFTENDVDYEIEVRATVTRSLKRRST